MSDKTRRKRCPNGFRRNPKTGHCESNMMGIISSSETNKKETNKKETKKRCPNGTRKNPKTGECEPKTNANAKKIKSQRNCKYGPRLANGKCPKKKLNASRKKTPILSKSSSNMSGKQYLVVIHLEKDIDWKPNYNTLEKQKEFFADQVFGEELLMRADADLIGKDIQINGKNIIFILKEQEVDGPIGNASQFNMENIVNSLERIKNNPKLQHNRKKIKFTFDVKPL
jgi:hypothetical protein